MSINEGEEILDALLFLGYRVQIADDGAITATQASQILQGKASMGTIEWADKSSMFRIKERAYIARLRARLTATQAVQAAVIGNSMAPEDSEAPAARPPALPRQRAAG